MRKPNLFIVGEPKCGTTAMIDFLGQHPDIFTTKFEVGAFADDLNALNDRWNGKKKGTTLAEAKKRYRLLFKDAKDEKYVGEATTGNLRSKVAAKKIHKFNPDARIIIMLRNPVEFLYSLHSQYVANMHESVTDFKQALELEDVRKQGKEIPKTTPFPEHLFYSDRTHFTEHIKRYLKYFPRPQIKIIIYDDFKKDNLKVYKDVLSWLSVDSSFEPETRPVNPNKFVRFGFLKRYLGNIGWWFYVKRLLPNFLERFISWTFLKIFYRETPRKPLDPSLRRELMKKYKPEVIKLSKLLDRNLVKEWGYDKI